MDFDKHRKSELLDLEKIEKYLIEKGYSNIILEQKWRHISGEVKKDEKKQFFKLASSEGVAERTENEYEWSKLMNLSMSDEEFPIMTPQVYDKGSYNDLFWFTCEHVDGKPLVLPNDTDKTKKLEKHLPSIAEMAYKILTLKTDNKLPNDLRSESIKDQDKIFLDRIQHWMGKLDKDVTGLYKYIEEKMKNAQVAPSHSDFVPWHIFITDMDKLFLIDAEHARIRGFKFYDVAYFYHRVYTKLKRPDISQSFLNNFQKLYKFSENDKDCFRLILAQRTIGGYLDAMSDNVTDPQYNSKLEEDILQDKIKLN